MRLKLFMIFFMINILPCELYAGKLNEFDLFGDFAPSDNVFSNFFSSSSSSSGGTAASATNANVTAVKKTTVTRKTVTTTVKKAFPAAVKAPVTPVKTSTVVANTQKVESKEEIQEEEDEEIKEEEKEEESDEEIKEEKDEEIQEEEDDEEEAKRKYEEELERVKKEKEEQAERNRLKRQRQQEKEKKKKEKEAKEAEKERRKAREKEELMERQQRGRNRDEDEEENSGFSMGRLLGSLVGTVSKTLSSPSSSETTANMKRSLLTGFDMITGNARKKQNNFVRPPKKRVNSWNSDTKRINYLTQNVLGYIDQLKLIDRERLKVLRAQSLCMCLNCYNASEYARESSNVIIKNLANQKFNGTKGKKADKYAVKDTINYLKNLGIIDEIKVAELRNIQKAKKLGVCIRCFKRRAGAYYEPPVKASATNKKLMSAVLGKVLDKNGKIIDKLSLFDADAPFGYVRGKNGKMRKALSADDAHKAVASDVNSNLFSGQMCLDKNGNLVPVSAYPKDPNAPYGYIKDKNTGILRAASSEIEAKQAVLVELQAQALAGNFVLDKTGNLLTKDSYETDDEDEEFGYMMDETGAFVYADSEVQAKYASIKIVESKIKKLQMAFDNIIINKDGKIVSYSSYSDATAPFGYFRENDKLRIATSIIEGLQAGNTEAIRQAQAGKMVVDAGGNLINISNFYSTNSPYGYAKNGAVVMQTAMQEKAKESAVASANAKYNTSVPKLKNLIINAKGDLIPSVLYDDAVAPNGYVFQANRSLKQATSYAQGTASAHQEAVLQSKYGNVLQDMSGNLVPKAYYLSSAQAPHGYVKNSDGSVGPAASADAAIKANTAMATTQAQAASKESGKMVIDANGNLVPAATFSDPNAPYGYVKNADGTVVAATSSHEAELAAHAETAKQAEAGNMVMDKNGNLVPKDSFNDPDALYGYVKDPVTGQMVPATSPEQAKAATSAQAAAQAAAAQKAASNMVMDKNGNLVPQSSISDPDAPFGYVKDPVTNQMVPATSAIEAMQAAKTEAAAQAASGNMVLDKNGNLVPKDSINDPAAPFGYVKDPVTNQMVPAKSADEAKKAATQVANAEKAAFEEKSGEMVLDASGNLVPAATFSDPNAPYGYVKDPATGALVVAISASQASEAAHQEAAAQAAAGNMVLDKNGNLVPKGSFNDPAAPFGYVKDANGNLIPATSVDAAKSAATATAQSNAAAAAAASGDYVLDVSGNLVKKSEFNDPAAPFGYMKDPETGKMVVASSKEAGLKAGSAAISLLTAAGQTLVDKFGNVVLKSEFNDPAAPFGYVKDAVTGSLVVAKSADEAKNSAQFAAAAKSGQYVLNSKGELVPASSLSDPAAPYGYIKGPDGSMKPASSPADAIKAANAEAVVKAASGEMVMNSNGVLVKKSDLNDPAAPFGYIKDENGNIVPATSEAQASQAAVAQAAESVKAAHADAIAKAANGEMVLNSEGVLVNKADLNDPNAQYGYVRDAKGNLVPAKSEEEAKQAAMTQAAAQAAASGAEPEKVINSKGELVLKSEYNDPAAPYGYIKDPKTQKLVAAKSPEEAAAYADQVQLQNAVSTNMVMDKNGNLVPLGTLNDPDAPYGYIKNANGTFSVAKSLSDAVSAANKQVAASKIVDLLVNEKGNLVSAISFTGTDTPYGYLKQNETDTQYQPADTLEEGLAYAQKVGASVLLLDKSGNLATLSKMAASTTPNGNVKTVSGGYSAAATLPEGIVAAKLKETQTLVLDKNGNLTPLSLLNDPAAPYGYTKNADGKVTPASTLDEGTASGKAAAKNTNLLKELGTRFLGSGFNSFIQSVKEGNVLGAVYNTLGMTTSISENFSSVSDNINSVKNAASNVKSRASRSSMISGSGSADVSGKADATRNTSTSSGQAKSSSTTTKKTTSKSSTTKKSDTAAGNKSKSSSQASKSGGDAVKEAEVGGKKRRSRG